MEVCDLDISCVVFDSDPQWLCQTISSLSVAVTKAIGLGQLKSAKLWLIDNHPAQIQVPLLKELANKFKTHFQSIELKFGHGNLGYGGGHNLAIRSSAGRYFLVLNPDVELDPDSLSVAIQYLEQYPKCALVAPDSFDSNGSRQYLAKRQPQLHVLAARALNIPWLTRLLQKSLSRYEYRDKIPANEPINIELASGCFMMMRGTVVRQLGGFNEKFFMYFEDFELSFRLRKLGALHYLPQVKIVHNGGAASKKGLRHIKYLIISFIRYKFIYWRGN